MIITIIILISFLLIVGWYRQKKLFSKFDSFIVESEKRTKDLKNIADKFEQDTNKLNGLLDNHKSNVISTGWKQVELQSNKAVHVIFSYNENRNKIYSLDFGFARINTPVYPIPMQASDEFDYYSIHEALCGSKLSDENIPTEEYMH